MGNHSKMSSAGGAAYHQAGRPHIERPKRDGAWVLYTKLKAVFFIGLGVFGAMKLEVIRVILDHPDIDRVVLGLGFSGWAAFAAIGLYVTQLSGLKNEREWAKHYPSAIPTATASAVAGFFLIVAGLWPYYKGWSLLMLGYFCFCSLECLSLLGWVPATSLSASSLEVTQ